MAIIRSFGQLQRTAVAQPSWQQVSGAAGGLGAYAGSYAHIYRTQPNVRTVVDFLARNVAQLGLHAYRRISDTDRERLAQHEVIDWLHSPNPATTRYRLLESTMQDLGVYYNAFWLKVRQAAKRIGLVRLSPQDMTVEGGLYPERFLWSTGRGEPREFAPTEIVHFGGYDPLNPLSGLSPIETLRRILAEEMAAQVYRARFLQNSARMDGFFVRPKEVKAWKQDQLDEFINKINAGYAGAGNAGKRLVLQEGMTFQQMDHSAKDSEINASRKLTREECAAAYHVPLPMVGILDHATFSNIKEQHKHLYADCLGPWLEMIQEELERQLLPEAVDTDKVYLEFNIAEKLRGSFEEQSASIVSAVGGPFMTMNEGRALLNLRSKENGDDVAKPLNMSTGQPVAEPEDVDTDAAARVVRGHWQRQSARLAKIPEAERPAAFTLTRWNAELAFDLQPILGKISVEVASLINRETLSRLHAGEDPFTRPVLLPELTR